MKTIEIEIYKFEELSKEAQQKAIEKLFTINVEHDWYDFTYEDAANIKLKLKEFGLDRDKHATGEFIDHASDCAFSIKDNHGADTDTYILANEFLIERDIIIDIAERDENGDFADECDVDGKLDECEAEFLNSLLDIYADTLQKESEYLQSDEAVKETIIANEYDFTIDGKMY